jgi:hypothetical protein
MPPAKRTQVLDTDGGAPPAPTGSRTMRDLYVPDAPALKSYFAAQGINVVMARNTGEFLSMMGVYDQVPVLVSELPESQREALLKDAKRHNWTVKDDTLRFGDCVLCMQPEEARQYWADQAMAEFVAQSGDEQLVENLNENARAYLDQMSGFTFDKGRVAAHAQPLTGGGAASHVMGGTRMREAYPGELRSE